MLPLFISIRILDIVDILIVGLLLYQFYMLIRGTVAINIFIAIFSIYLFWLVVKALNMQLLGSILGQVIGVGIIALIIVFQQEIRRFLLMLGTRYMSRKFSLENFFSFKQYTLPKVRIRDIARAVVDMAKIKTGALIVIARNSTLDYFGENAEVLNANTTANLLESIFFKSSPLHDGAVIIIADKIHAARCVLPISSNIDPGQKLGMRHRAAIGMSEHNDSLTIVVSEETGQISIAEFGKIRLNVSTRELVRKLEKEA